MTSHLYYHFAKACIRALEAQVPYDRDLYWWTVHVNRYAADFWWKEWTATGLRDRG
jgi:hypothetical protein